MLSENFISSVGIIVICIAHLMFSHKYSHNYMFITILHYVIKYRLGIYHLDVYIVLGIYLNISCCFK